MSNKSDDLRELLEEVTGLEHVYFQPPPNFTMEYPCIVFSKNRINTNFADNKPYQLTQTYRITYIFDDPDSDVPMKIASLPMCVFERDYEANELYHNVYRIVY